MNRTTLRRFEIPTATGTLKRMIGIGGNLFWILDFDWGLGKKLLTQAPVTPFQNVQEAKLPLRRSRFSTLLARSVYGHQCFCVSIGNKITPMDRILSLMTLEVGFLDRFSFSSVNVLDMTM